MDLMLRCAGDFGRYQHILFILFSIINVITAFHYFGQTFLNILPQNDCLLPEISQTYQSIIVCNRTIVNSTARIQSTCSDSMYGYISMTQEFNWTNEKNWIPVLGQSIYFIGSVIGSLTLGILADRIGRLYVLIIANLLAFIGNICTIFSTEALSYTLSRFIAGLATDSNFVMMYIIVMEYMRPSKRTFSLNLCIGLFYCLACTLVPWVAVAMNTWKRFLLVVTIPHLVVLGYHFILPESAQWLLSKGRIEDAIQCFKKIALINKRQISDEAIDDLRIYNSKHIIGNRSVNVFGLFKTPKLRRKTTILIFKSMVITLGYDAISRNINGLGYSPFVIFSITSTTILPACVFIMVLQDRIGRKAMASGSLLLSGVFTYATSYILFSYSNIDAFLTSSLMFVSRFGINVAYNSGAQYAVELIPTEVRGQGVSTIHVAGYVASFFSPQLLYLNVYWKPLPELVLGTLLIVGAMACLTLPETLNKTLPITLEDGEAFGEDENLCDFSCCIKGRSDSQQTLVLKQ